MTFEKETAIQARDRGYKDGEAGVNPLPNHGYQDERTAAYIDGHRLGKLVFLRGGIEPDWAIDDDVEIIALAETDSSFRVIEVGGQHRQVVISWSSNSGDNDDPRMLFDGVDIDTEAFMAYVGLQDMVFEADKLVGHVIHCKNGELL